MTHDRNGSHLQIGQYNLLRVMRSNKSGLFLEGPRNEEVFLPKKEIPRDLDAKPGDLLELFIYTDGKGRFVGTTHKPYATVGQFVDLEVIEINDIGIFLNWGLPKDLMLPFSEEVGTLYKGDFAVVYLYLDRLNRITATMKYEGHLDQTPFPYQEGEPVNLVVADKTGMGFKVIIEHAHWGLIHKNEVFMDLHIGDEVEGFIKRIREDGKIDVSLQPTQSSARSDLENRILAMLEEKDGVLLVSDKSDPELIHETFGVSKSNFKKATGALYKEGKILIEPYQITLIGFEG